MYKSMKRSSLCLVLAMTMTAPYFAHAQSLPIKLPIDVGMDDPQDGSQQSDTGLGPAQPSIPKVGIGPVNPGTQTPGETKPGQATTPGTSAPKPGGSPAPTTGTPSGTKGATIAAVGAEFNCSILNSPTNADLFKAIDALSTAVGKVTSCTDNPSAKDVKANGDKIKENIEALAKMMAVTDPSQVNLATIDSSVTAALGAVANLGDIFNNSQFINSACGRQSMTSGKVLLALNDVVAGLAPYALFAVSMNAALTPALPFVVGGAIATSSISAISKMLDKGALDMKDANVRKAVWANTCAFTKVATKVRFMQLAQSGKIEKITQELEKDVDLYRVRFKNPTNQLTSILAYKSKMDKYFGQIEKQLESDKADLNVVSTQVAQNSQDDLLMCTLGQELANWAQDGKTFPSSVFNNLNSAISQSDKSQKLQAATMKALHESNMKRVRDFAPRASEDESALKTCAQATRSWISGVRQATEMTTALTQKNKNLLANQLNEYSEYRTWKASFDFIENQKITIKRVEKAMQELQKDTSVIDRSELAQRMVSLKAGLFGTRGFGWGNKPSVPVLDWMEHTKAVSDRSVAAFLVSFKAVRDTAYSITETGLGKSYVMTNSGAYYVNPQKQERDLAIAEKLSNLNLDTVQFDSRQHQIICQNLEAAWIDWSATLDHLGSIKLFCDMIDPVLDAKMDQAVVEQCRGVTKLSGVEVKKSMVNSAKEALNTSGYQAKAAIVSAKLKELQCPMPTVSVMNKE
ncbi:hypothetical protein [Bdellovibrio sp. HCB2-146]|uniref:hypothetical protein n=1 Tax=Bdellovibrio sp. HCB2-146 TaxID=3394362 RepID=UPI0039BD27B3